MLVQLPNGEWIDPDFVRRVLPVRSTSHAMTRTSRILESPTSPVAVDKTPRVLVVLEVGNGDHVVPLYCETDHETKTLSDQVASVINDARAVKG